MELSAMKLLTETILNHIKIVCATGCLALLANSCAYMAREMVAPKSCKKCNVYDEQGNVVWTEDDCGGGVHNMVLRGKAAAYDLGCNHVLKCQTYKAEVEQ